MESTRSPFGRTLLLLFCACLITLSVACGKSADQCAEACSRAYGECRLEVADATSNQFTEDDCFAGCVEDSSDSGVQALVDCFLNGEPCDTCAALFSGIDP